MGALDDAIREHLELKRQHGASDEEITRAEAEALGPARRAPGSEPLDALDPLDEPMPPPDPAEGASLGEHYGAELRPPEGDYLITDPPPPPAPPGASGLTAEPVPVAEPDAPPVEPHPVEPVDEHAPAAEPPAAFEPSGREPEPVEPVAGHAPAAEPPASFEPAAHEPDPVEPAAAVEPAAHEPPAPEPTAPIARPPATAPTAPEPPDDYLEEAPPPGTPKPHGDPALRHDDPPPIDPDRQRTAILDDPLDELAPRDQAPLHREPGPDEPPAPSRPPGSTSAAGGPDEDVLEETPDFLQETPEHDRLWFEQKPPRDFDFDD